jgi:hypothetical protein
MQGIQPRGRAFARPFATLLADAQPHGRRPVPHGPAVFVATLLQLARHFAHESQRLRAEARDAQQRARDCRHWAAEIRAGTQVPAVAAIETVEQRALGLARDVVVRGAELPADLGEQDRHAVERQAGLLRGLMTEPTDAPRPREAASVSPPRVAARTASPAPARRRARQRAGTRRTDQACAAS